MRNAVWGVLIILFVVLVFAAFNKKNRVQDPKYIAFTGATIIDGSGAVPISNAVLLISSGRILAIGTKEQVTIPENTTIINVSGKTIIPGLINAHGHVGDVKGIEPGNYSLKNIEDNLKTYGRYGITTVVSLGGDGQEAVPLRDIKSPSGLPMARLYIAGAVITGRTPEQAVTVTNANHRMGVDFMKIRVDDNLGSTQKMPEAIYKAVIDRSHGLGYLMAVHMYYLDDAKKLLRAGADMLAHSIRDRKADDELIKLMRERNAYYCPTLTRELSTYVYESTPAFFSDPFFTREYNRQTIAPLLDPSRQQQMKNSQSAQTYKNQLPIAMANLKILSDQGIPVVMGTDSGVPLRFIGYFEHVEMEMMAQAGLTPMQILISATRDAAKYMELKEIGLLKAGYKADIVVLDKNPLTDIKNTRSISQVWIGGNKLNLDMK
jgi:imidazolonepropionase-like amidohydrolase